MQINIKAMYISTYVSDKNKKAYITLVDLENGEKVKLIATGVPEVKEGSVVEFQGHVTPGQYGFTIVSGNFKKSE